MKRIPLKWVLTLLSLALVVTLFLLDTRRTSPGELSPVHAQLKELSGSEGCDKCHGGFAQSMGSACLDCHALVRESFEQKRGLHGTLQVEEPLNCARCHVEHHGSQVEIAGARAFSLAGVPQIERFDHGQLGFLLQGVHVTLQCAQCHPQADAAVLTPGKPRFAGLSQDCATCHRDPHAGRMQRACADCHGQSQPFLNVAEFNHGASFASRGAHARAACTACHAPDSPRSVEALGGEHPPVEARACIDCHASPHSAGFVQRIASANAVLAGDGCVVCHDPERGPFATPQLPQGVDWHAASGFSLVAPHGAVACDQCHPSASGDARATAYPGRKPDDCVACHADPHGGQFAQGARAEAGCLGCHERSGFKPALFDAAQHASTAFPLEGAHLNAQCARCHTRDPQRPESPLIFAAASTECAACHADAHAGAFSGQEFRAGFPKLAAQGCAACHDTRAFDHGARLQFDHTAMTAFALDGSHGTATCERCHPKSTTADDRGRRFGRAAELFPGPLDKCATCHADVHGGTFAARGFALQREADCAMCHTTAHFNDGAKAKFEHGPWTGFALDGAHGRADCSVCHRPLKHSDPQGRKFERASEQFSGPPDRCATCHADPHQGRFDQTPKALSAAANAPGDCARCHSQESFQQIDSNTFDHGAWTGFVLEGAHAETLCVACHSTGNAAHAPGRRLGKVPGTNCGDCHADPHAQQFDLDGRTDCARCHGTSGNFATPKFDHQRDARFALDATHSKLACGACHVPQLTAAGSRAVRYRPLGMTCADCHGTTDRRVGKDG